MRSTTLEINPRRTVAIVGAIAVLLVCAGTMALVSKYGFGHDTVRGLVPLFDLDEDNNIPAYYEAATLLLCSCLAFAIGAAVRKRRRRYHLHWIGLGGILAFLSMDELGMIHERVTWLFRHGSGASGPFYVSWVIVYAGLVVVVGITYLRFVLHLPADTRRLVLASGTIYVVGAIGFEAVGGYYLSTHGWRMGLSYDLIVVVEETLEAVGVLLLIYALLSYAGTHLGNLTVRIGASGAESPIEERGAAGRSDGVIEERSATGRHTHTGTSI